ncbi:helix-turn-helix domain-containing protein [Salimicrobium jeotgali]|uniref:helix-turn-helix domain-containing protein n=1 Tax=Salimicrobium jeotgali TaxID=1230341 RepID=UPI000C85275E|nr:GAF domain-containing protein [Salimicrobium jeotgali]
MDNEKKLMSLINSVNVLNSTRDLPEVLEQLIQEVLNVVGGANKSVLFLYDDKADILYAKTAVGFDMTYMKEIRLKPGEGMSGKTFLDEKGRIFSSLEDTVEGMSDISENIRNIYSHSLGRMEYPVSAICVPLISDGKCIGVLTVDVYEDDVQFEQEDLRLLETFANQASIAIENATLFSQNERNKRIHEELSKVSLAKGGLADITSTLSKLIDEPVIVYNEMMDIIATSDKELDSISLELKEETIQGAERPVFETETLSEQVSLNGEERLVYFFPIAADTRFFGLLAVPIMNGTDVDPLDQFAVEQAVTVFAMEIDRQERLVEEHFNYSGSILERIIHHPYEDLSSLNLTEMNFPEHDYHNYCIAQLYFRDPLLSFEKMTEKKQKIMRMFYREFSRLPYRTLVYDRNLEVNVMFTVPGYLSETAVYEKLGRIFNKIMGYSAAYAGISGSIGLGRTVTKLNEVHYSYYDAKRCVEFLQSTYQERYIMNYRQLGPYRLFLKMERDELRNYRSEILLPIIEHDEKYGSELLDTLKIYLDTNQNMAESGRRLFLHVNTIKYRLATIYKILDIKSLSGKKTFELQLAFRINDYLNE